MSNEIDTFGSSKVPTSRPTSPVEKSPSEKLPLEKSNPFVISSHANGFHQTPELDDEEGEESGRSNKSSPEKKFVLLEEKDPFPITTAISIAPKKDRDEEDQRSKTQRKDKEKAQNEDEDPPAA